MANFSILSERQQVVYDTLCDLYGEDAVNFFTNCLGMQICEDEGIYSELVDMGIIEEDEEDDEEFENEWDN